MVEVRELSNDDKKVIKENAQKLKTFFVLRNCDDCQEFYGWCDSNDDFLDYIGRILPFIKDEKQYILVDGVQDLIHEIDSAIENVKTCITIDDFDEVDDLIEFIDKCQLKPEYIAIDPSASAMIVEIRKRSYFKRRGTQLHLVYRC